MDTSETYKKMCEKAVEIQALRYPSKDIEDSIKPWLDGDFFYVAPDPRWPNEEGELGIAYYCDDYYYSQPQCDAIWLPRQDQLQEMESPKGFTGFIDWQGWLKNIYPDQENPFDTRAVRFHSWEQLWLAFVMKEKYNKVWDGGDWVSCQLLCSLSTLP